MSDWAVRLQRSDAAKIGRLRRRPGIEVLETEDAIWLRGGSLDEELENALRSVPGARRFRVLPDGQLVPAGAQVPKGHLPDGPWTSIPAWMSVELKAPALAGRVEGRAPLELVRSGAEQEANVLWATMAAWSDWAVRGAQVRLDRLVFAADGESAAVIRGTPLPPVRGRRYVESDGVAVEAGWAWSPPLEAGVVRQALGLDSNDLALLHSDGTWDHIPGEAFVRATRSAVRATAGGIDDA